MRASDSKPAPPETPSPQEKDPSPLLVRGGHPLLLFAVVVLLVAGVEFVWMMWLPKGEDLLAQMGWALLDAALVALLLSLLLYRLFYKPLLDEVQARREAQQAENLLRLALTQAADAILLTDAQGRILFVNHQFERLGGYQAGEMVGKGIGLIFAPEGKAGAEEIRIAMAWNKVYATETVIRRQDGAQWPASATLAPVRAGAREEVTHFLFSLREIASRKRMEAQMRLLTAELEAIVENSAVGILHVKGNRIMRINAQLEELFGWGEEEVWGQSPERFHPTAGDYQAMNQEAAGMFAAGQAYVVDRPMRHRDGSILWCRLAGRVIAFGGRFQEEIWIIDDVTRKKEEEALLHQAKEAAESASRAKSSFLANMSHELRSPMSAVIGMTELLLKGELKPEQREHLEIVRQSAESLLGLLDALLDFSRIEAGRLEIEQVPFDLRRVVESACETLAVTAYRKGLELLCHLREEPAAEVLGDALRLRQVLVNLLGNAIKFTQQGEVTLRVIRDGEKEGTPCYRISIADTGIGIPPEKLERIFDSFTQADSSTTRRYGGSGLGLTICRQLTELMGGEIGVESVVGQGSVFFLTLPLPPAAGGAQLADRRMEKILDGVRILVSTPSAAGGEILREMLADMGATVELSSSALEALARIRAALWSQRPFALLLQESAIPDVGVLAEEEESPLAADAVCPAILMLPAGFRQEEFFQSRRQGGARTLLKPVRKKALLSAILAVLGRQEEELAGWERQPGRHSQRSMRILLAEDSPASRLLAQNILRGAGHEVTVVENGREALAQLGVTPFDLALLDIHMPEVDGLGVVRVVRAGGAAANPATLAMAALTADAVKGQREKYLDSGFDAYLSKPFREEQLLMLVQRMAAKGADGAREVFDQVRERLAQEARNQQQALSADQEMGARRQAFRENLPALLEEMRGSLEQKDYAGVERLARQIKEQAEPLGLDGLRHGAMEVILSSRKRSRFAVEGGLEQLAFEARQGAEAEISGEAPLS